MIKWGSSLRQFGLLSQTETSERKCQSLSAEAGSAVVSAIKLSDSWGLVCVGSDR